MNATAAADVAATAETQTGAAEPGVGGRRRALSLRLVWWAGALSFAAIILAFSPYTYSLDDIKVTLQYVMGPIVGGLLAVAVVRGHTQPVHPWIGLTLSAYVLLGLLSTLTADFPWVAWQEWGFELAAMAAFGVVALTATTIPRFRNFCRFFFAIGCVTILFGLFHYYGGVRWLTYQLFPEGRVPEGGPSPLYALLMTLTQNPYMLSTILNRDFYPAYLLMTAPVTVAFFLESRSLFGRAFYGLAGLLYVGCIILTKSNDSYLATFAIVVLLAVFLVRGKPWEWAPRKVRRAWAAGGAVLLLTLLFFGRSYFGELRGHLRPSVRSRVIMWSAAWDIFCDPGKPAGTFVRHLFVGSGPGGFLELFPDYRAPDYHRWGIAPITQFSHSQPMDLLSERGLLGFLAFAAFLGGMLRLLYRELRKGRDRAFYPYQVAVFAGLVGISLQNLTSPNIRWTACAFNYWFLLGLGAAAVRLGMKEEERELAARAWALPPALGRIVAVAFLIAMVAFEAVSIPYGLRRFPAAMYNNQARIAESDLAHLMNGMNSAPRDQTERLRQAALEAAKVAEDRCRKSLRWMPTFISSHYLLGTVLAKHGSLATKAAEKAQAREQAMRVYDRLIALAPEYADIDTMCGLLYEQAWSENKKPEYKERALRHLGKAAAMTTAYYPRLLYARSLIDMGESQKAYTVYAGIVDTLRSWPPDRFSSLGIQEVYESLLTEARAANNREQMVELWRLQLEAQPYDATVFVALTQVLRQTGRHAEALKLCVKWAERDPLDALPRMVAASVFLDNRAFRRALTQLQAVLFIQRYRKTSGAAPWAVTPTEDVKALRDPPPAEVWLRAGQIFEHWGATSEALKYYEVSLTEGGNSPLAVQARLAIVAMRARMANAKKK